MRKVSLLLNIGAYPAWSPFTSLTITLELPVLQVQLYEGTAEHLVHSSEDQYDTALAYLTLGYCTRRPQLVRTAQKLLAAVKLDSDSTSSMTDIGERINYTEDVSMCSISNIHLISWCLYIVFCVPGVQSCLL